MIEIQENSLKHLWKMRPSEISGYARQYYSTTLDGDEITIDFNFPRQMARIMLTIAAEHGRQYIAVIKSGTILKETDVSARCPMDLTSRISRFRQFFLFIPDDTVLSVIGGNYGIPARPLPVRYRRKIIYFPSAPKLELGKKLRILLQRRRKRELEERSFFEKAVHRLKSEAFDFSLGGVLALSYFQHLISIAEFAGLIGFLGIASGAVDWLWRHRSPFLPRILVMLGASAWAVHHQVQYRMWSLFL